MKQANIYAEAEIDGVTYQWLAYRDGDLARVDMHQQLVELSHQQEMLKKPSPDG